MHEAGMAVTQENALQFMVLLFFMYCIDICGLILQGGYLSRYCGKSYLSQANFSFAICVLGNLGNWSSLFSDCSLGL